MLGFNRSYSLHECSDCAQTIFILWLFKFCCVKVTVAFGQIGTPILLMSNTDCMIHLMQEFNQTICRHMQDVSGTSDQFFSGSSW